MIGLYPFGWQACFESQKLTEATVRIWLTSIWQRVLDKGSFSNFAFWNVLFCLEPAPFTFHSLFLSHSYFNAWVLNQQNSCTFVSKFCQWYESWWWQLRFFASWKGFGEVDLRPDTLNAHLWRGWLMWPHGHSFNWRGLSWLGKPVSLSLWHWRTRLRWTWGQVRAVASPMFFT